MKIGIIGCGYVGQAMAINWKQQGYKVAVTTRCPDRVAYLKNFADHVHLLGQATLASFIEQQEIILISVAPDPSTDYASTYLDVAQQVSAQVTYSSSLQHILYTSSTTVYGEHGGAWVDETTPLILEQEKAKILYKTEQILLGCSHQNLKVCVLRLGEIYGPGREIEQRLRCMQSQPFSGTGQSYTNLIHLTDIQHALDFALKYGLQGIYNLASDFHVTRQHFYHQICQQEKLLPIQWDKTKISAHPGNRRVSNQKIKNEGFTFTHPQYFTR